VLEFPHRSPESLVPEQARLRLPWELQLHPLSVDLFLDRSLT
jgi:hypothetical protein